MKGVVSVPGKLHRHSSPLASLSSHSIQDQGIQAKSTACNKCLHVKHLLQELNNDRFL